MTDDAGLGAEGTRWGFVKVCLLCVYSHAWRVATVVKGDDGGLVWNTRVNVAFRRFQHITFHPLRHNAALSY